MPKYWKEIAINAQEEAAMYAAEAAKRRDAGEVSAWGFYSKKSDSLYSRARWAMSVPEDCP